MGGKKTTATATSSKNMLDDGDESQSSSLSELEEEEEEEELERELADVTFEELQKARSSGFRSALLKPSSESKPRRANKNRPMEMSSKKPVGRFREVIQAPKKVGRDPRFESLCGNLDTDGFKKRYNFLFEFELPAEREKLQKLIKKSNDPQVIEDLNKHVSWIDKQLKAGSAKSVDAKILAEHKKKEREAAKQGKQPFYLKKSKSVDAKILAEHKKKEREAAKLGKQPFYLKKSKSVDAKILAEHKKKEREAAKQGKQPFYLKKSEIRERKLVEKYNHLKATGKLVSFIEKRRRRNVAKDRRHMPYRRAHDNV